MWKEYYINVPQMSGIIYTQNTCAFFWPVERCAIYRYCVHKMCHLNFLDYIFCFVVFAFQVKVYWNRDNQFNGNKSTFLQKYSVFAFLPCLALYYKMFHLKWRMRAWFLRKKKKEKKCIQYRCIIPQELLTL